MPEEDVSDLRDVVDAINKLCETMKTSCDDDCDDPVSSDLTEDGLVDPAEVTVTEVETYVAEKWCEPASEPYYTASASSDSECPEADAEAEAEADAERDRSGVLAGHVAAMRERFESMTRTNTPCPDLMRSLSPSFEVIRNISTSPDLFDKS